MRHILYYSNMILLLITSFRYNPSHAFRNSMLPPSCYYRHKILPKVGMHVTTKTTTTTTTTTTLHAILDQDIDYLKQALEYAKIGFGHTYPNPAVGCVLVRQDTNQIVGCGFHPRAGYPHAEVFALLEAAGHVTSGVDAARSILHQTDATGRVHELAKKYSTAGGPEELFGNAFDSIPVTAYVTLEPCCHYGKTPPCAASLAVSKVRRVVVGFRDPNPRVDGGGVQLLQEAGIEVALVDGEVNTACANMVDAFVKRITPRNKDLSWINGPMRSALRRLAGTRKSSETLTQVHWNGESVGNDDDDDDGDDVNKVDELVLDATWLELVDRLLWEHELVNLRLNRAVGKKKLAKRLGERIAAQLDAHVAQTVGHTTLLYRPGIPPVMDLQKLAEELNSKK